MKENFDLYEIFLQLLHYVPHNIINSLQKNILNHLRLLSIIISFNPLWAPKSLKTIEMVNGSIVLEMSFIKITLCPRITGGPYGFLSNSWFATRKPSFFPVNVTLAIFYGCLRNSLQFSWTWVSSSQWTKSEIWLKLKKALNQVNT